MQDYPAVQSTSVVAEPSPLRQLVRRGLAATLPRRLFMTSGPPGSSAVALTFDDGPHPTHTPAVLDRLRELRVRATFFVVGDRAAARPELVARIAAEGHAIGHHSYTHGAPHETSALALIDEARRTAALLERVLGARPSLFRPPHGKLTPGKLLGLWGLGQTVVLWNRDPKDWACGAIDPIRRWFQTEPLAGGDILLLHDAHAHIAPALDAIVERAASLGLGFCTPTDWRHA
jgi:peptidoglycan/xylan/chitin deacetylase (PgdA/CDA1 family)